MQGPRLSGYPSSGRPQCCHQCDLPELRDQLTVHRSRAWIVAILLVPVTAVACAPTSRSAPRSPSVPSKERLTDTSQAPGGGQPSATFASAGTGASQPVTGSRREQAEALAECTARQGVHVTVDPSGDGVTWRAPTGQEEVYNDVVNQCAEEVAKRFGIDTGDPTPTDLARWYDAYVTTYHCMIDHGYPSDPPPSKDAYVDSGGTIWHPYNAIFAGDDPQLRPGEPFSSEAFRELENTCPQDLTYLLNHQADSQ